jgi:hypothetical protein
LNADERLQRADEHIFSTGLSDSGARLALANMRYGLAKMHYVQEELGLRPDATFVAAPDLTVTRDSARWRSGFGYGGAITWGDGSAELVILDLKPNACGILVGGLDQLPNRFEVMERAHELAASEAEIDGVRVTWDFGKSNHFIDVCSVVPVDGHVLPPYAFLMHFAGDELRGDGEHGPGIGCRCTTRPSGVCACSSVRTRASTSDATSSWSPSCATADDTPPRSCSAHTSSSTTRPTRGSSE